MAPASPTASPARTAREWPAITRRTTAAGCAPSAIRMPISRVRCRTAYANTPNIPTVASTSANAPSAAARTGPQRADASMALRDADSGAAWIRTRGSSPATTFAISPAGAAPLVLSSSFGA